MTYAEKLKDPRWQKLRLKVLDRDNWMCQICFDTESTLHVHHRYYLSNKEPWEYPMVALVTLCHSCHTLEGNDMPIAEKKLIEALKKSGFTSIDMEIMANGLQQFEMCHNSDLVATAFALYFSSPELQRTMVDLVFKMEAQKTIK